MDQFGRCRIGSEVFGSDLFGSVMSTRHIKSSYVLAKDMEMRHVIDITIEFKFQFSLQH